MITKIGSPVINGLSNTLINCNLLKPGMYLVYITVDGVTNIQKIEKK